MTRSRKVEISVKNYDEMDMRQTSQYEDEEQEIDGMNLYCLIGMICSILGTLIMLVLHFVLGLCIGIAGITLSAVGLYMHNRTKKNLSGKVFGKVGIIVPIVGIVIYIVLIVLGLIWAKNLYNDAINPALDSTINDLSDDQMFSSTDWDSTSTWASTSTSSPMLISRGSSKNITISEILNSRAQGYGTTQIYKMSVSRLDGLKLSDIGKDTQVEVWNYDGQSVAQVLNNVSLGTIAGKEYTASAGVSDGYDVAFNIVTDKSGNNTLYEELRDENGNVEFLFGAQSEYYYSTTITVYNTTYLCFIESLKGDDGYITGCVTFIEDKSDTVGKNILLDTVGAQGVTVDGN